jgi:CHASE2 domain-containing sensor protein
MKYIFKRDTILVTILVFIVIVVVGMLPLNMSALSPIRLVLSDISFNDLAFSPQNAQNMPMDDRIVIVNIDTMQRQAIADLINRLETFSPAAIGVDVLFLERKDSVIDTYLLQTLKAYSNIVASEQLEWQKDETKNKDVPEVKSIFINKDLKAGYVNFIAENSGVIRYYSPFEKGEGYAYSAFSSAVIQTARPKEYNVLVKRNKETEWINYKRTANQYYIFNGVDILHNVTDTSFFKNKIILVGFYDDDPNHIEDKHFTPLNTRFVGKSIPDMDGIVINANIISMVLDNEFIHKSPLLVNVLLAVCITWISFAVFLHFYLHRHLSFHIIVPIIQLISAILSIYVSILLLKFLRLNIDFTLSVLAIVIAIEVLYFYEALALWLHKKYRYKTIFAKKNHHK